MYRLESYAPISGKWFPSGPDSDDVGYLQYEMAKGRAFNSPVALRIVDVESGDVICEYRPS